MYIVNHKEVALAEHLNVLFNLYLIAFAQLKHNFRGDTQQHPLHKNNLVDYLIKSFKTPPKIEDEILGALMQMGKVTRKKDNGLEFAD